MFNSLKYAKKLEEVGFTREQAEAHIQIMTDVIETSLATKQDFKDLQAASKQDIKDLREQDIKDLKDEIQKLEYRLTIRLGTIVSIAVGVAVTLAKMV